MKTNDYVKYLTQQFVQHYNVPKAERKENRQLRKEEKYSPVSTWFGILPMAIAMFFKKLKRNQMS